MSCLGVAGRVSGPYRPGRSRRVERSSRGPGHGWRPVARRCGAAGSTGASTAPAFKASDSDVPSRRSDGRASGPSALPGSTGGRSSRRRTARRPGSGLGGRSRSAEHDLAEPVGAVVPTIRSWASDPGHERRLPGSSASPRRRQSGRPSRRSTAPRARGSRHGSAAAQAPVRRPGRRSRTPRSRCREEARGAGSATRRRRRRVWPSGVDRQASPGPPIASQPRSWPLPPERRSVAGQAVEHVA